MAEKIKLASVDVAEIGDYKFMIEPDMGGWLLMDDRSLAVARRMDGEKTVKEIAGEFPELELSEVSRLARMLKDQGLTEGKAPRPSPREIIPRPFYAVLNMTEQCNLNCKYCYANSGYDKSAKMTADTAIRIVDEMRGINRDGGRTPGILFHGGEPLLNFEAVRAVAEYVEPFAGEVSLNIQTNATLIRQEHINFFKKHNIGVGVSLDGPAHLHDLTRIGQNGAGSYAETVRGIRALGEAGIGVGSITVLNRHNYAYAGEIADHLIGMGIKSFVFNPIIAGGRCGDSEELYVTGEQLFEAYKAVMDRVIDYNSWCADPSDKVQERTLKHLMRNVLLHKRDYMCMRTPCGAGIDILGFSTDGGAYVCDDVVGEPGFLLGNVCSAKLAELISGGELIAGLSARSIDAVGECPACVWRALCNGVCMCQTYYLNQAGFADNPSCDFRKRFIPYLIESYAGNPALPGLLDREFTGETGRRHYFNINYDCNSSCVFCASDSAGCGDSGQGEIDAETFAALLKINRVSRGDSVTINGGEPTVSSHLIGILSSIRDAGAYSCLFTNGRRLGGKDYCRSVIETGVNMITIPLFGNNAADHDSLTMTPGSFEEVNRGISNILETREREGRGVELALKLLYIKPTLETNPKILEWIVKTYPKVDCVSLNSLIVSDTVKKRREALVPDAAGWRRSVNNTLDYAREHDLEELVQLWDVPFCLLEKRNYCFLPPVSKTRNEDAMRYFDAKTLGGQDGRPDPGGFPAPCRECAYMNQCRFMNRLYFNDQTAKDSIDMLFA